MSVASTYFVIASVLPPHLHSERLHLGCHGCSLVYHEMALAVGACTVSVRLEKSETFVGPNFAFFIIFNIQTDYKFSIKKM